MDNNKHSLDSLIDTWIEKQSSTSNTPDRTIKVGFYVNIEYELNVQ